MTQGDLAVCRMRLQAIVLALFLNLAPHSPSCAQGASDKAEIQQLFDRFQDSWNTPGMPGFEALFTKDADFVVISGKWLEGRDETVIYHRDLLQHGYAKSTLFVDRVTVRFVTDKLAIVHMQSGARFERNGQEEVRTSLSTSTVVKAGGRWLITAFHNTLTGGPGFAFGMPSAQK